MKITIGNETVEFTHKFDDIDETLITADVISSLLNLLSSKLQIEDLKMGINSSDDNVLKATQKLAAIFAEIAVKCKDSK